MQNIGIEIRLYNLPADNISHLDCESLFYCFIYVFGIISKIADEISSSHCYIWLNLRAQEIPDAFWIIFF